MRKLLTALMILTAAGSPAAPAKLKALLVAGGCCHDYANQHKVLSDGIQALANVQVDVWWTDDKSVNPPLDIYNDPNWAQGYDVVIHDECAAGNRDLKLFQRVLDAHKTVPSVHLHCAMHSFRNGTDKWFKQRFHPNQILAEVPFHYTNDSGQSVTGFIDLLLETNQGWIIIDHKSFPGGRSEWDAKALSYSGQLRAYCDALHPHGIEIAEKWIHFVVGGGMIQVSSSAI